MCDSKRSFTTLLVSASAELLLVGVSIMAPLLAQGPIGDGEMGGTGHMGPGDPTGDAGSCPVTPFGFAPGWMMDDTGASSLAPGSMMSDMTWNLKYGMMSGFGGYGIGGMMTGGFGNSGRVNPTGHTPAATGSGQSVLL